VLWGADANFRPEFDSALDSILGRLGYQARRPDGFLGEMPKGGRKMSTGMASSAIRRRRLPRCCPP
jgi:hypothetical protein